MFDVMTALATASQAVKLTQDLRGIDKAMDAAEFKLKIADLSGALSDIRIALADAKEELSSKQSEIDALKKKFARIEDTVQYQGYKYSKAPDGTAKGAPFCPVCEQKQGIMIHIVDFRNVENCPSCNSKYKNLRFFDE
jgi:phage-related tail protein